MPIKLTTYNSGGKERKKISKRIYRISQNTGIINVLESFLSLQSLQSIISLTGSHCPPHLPRMPSNTVLFCGPAVGAAQILMSPNYVCPCLQCPQLPKLVCILLWELSMPFFMFHRYICLVDHVDLICTLYSW